MTDRYGWKLVFHDTIRDQLEKLSTAVASTDHLKQVERDLDPNVQALNALSQLMFKTIPEDPNCRSTLVAFRDLGHGDFGGEPNSVSDLPSISDSIRTRSSLFSPS